MRKKISIVGRGTVGCLTVAHYLKYTDWNVDWIFDPNVPALAVGEGTNLTFSRALYDLFEWTHNDLNNIQGTVKQGIYKENWGVGNKFLHAFPINQVGIHLSAAEFQTNVFETLVRNPRLTPIEKKITDYNSLDSDFIMVCAGGPRELDDQYVSRTHIPVNSAYVTQCHWARPEFTHSLTIARPWGWVFGIPLQKRCSIGYIYNDNITDLDDIKQDVAEVFKQYNLTPSQTTNHIRFNNYSRINNFTERVIYNGNASFFLEPLEATSIGTAAQVNRLAWNVWTNGLATQEADMWYHKEISDVESMICLHYMAGSIFKNEFWSYASSIARERIENEFRSRSEFSFFVANSMLDQNLKNLSGIDVGTWPETSYNTNIKNLGLADEIIKLKDRYLS
jgi:hypothetical protein